MVQSVWGTVRLFFYNEPCFLMARSIRLERMMGLQLICSVTLAGGQARGSICTTAIWWVLFGHVKEGIFRWVHWAFTVFSHGLPTPRSSIPFFLLRFLRCALPPRQYMLYIRWAKLRRTHRYGDA